jgi:hypothetical protein
MIDEDVNDVLIIYSNEGRPEHCIVSVQEANETVEFLRYQGAKAVKIKNIAYLCNREIYEHQYYKKY